MEGESHKPWLGTASKFRGTVTNWWLCSRHIPISNILSVLSFIIRMPSYWFSWKLTALWRIKYNIFNFSNIANEAYKIVVWIIQAWQASNTDQHPAFRSFIFLFIWSKQSWKLSLNSAISLFDLIFVQVKKKEISIIYVYSRTINRNNLPFINFKSSVCHQYEWSF